MGHDGVQQCGKIMAFLVVQYAEQGLLAFLLGIVEFAQQDGSGVGDSQPVAAAVVRVAVAGQIPLIFQVVDEPNHVAFVHIQHVTQILLTARALVIDGGQDREMVWTQVMNGQPV